MLGTQVNALVIAFLHRETLALTKASSFPINSSTKASSFPINSSIFQNVSNARGLPWGTLMPSPRATIKFVTAPPLDWQREQMILGCPGGGGMGTTGNDWCIRSMDMVLSGAMIHVLYSSKYNTFGDGKGRKAHFQYDRTLWKYTRIFENEIYWCSMVLFPFLRVKT